MYLILNRIWFACMVFGALLSFLSFMIALDTDNGHFVYIGIAFIIINLVGFFNVINGMKKDD